MLPPPTQFQMLTRPAPAERLETSSIASRVTLHDPAHILVPVDIKRAQSMEHEEQQAVELRVKDDEQVRQDSLLPKKEQVVEMGRASVSRPRDFGVPEVKDVPMESTECFSVASVQRSNLLENKQTQEMQDSAAWSKPNVYSLANVSVSIHESITAQPIVVRNESESNMPQETTSSTVTSPDLYEKAEKTTHSVLNRAKEETLARELNQSTEIVQPEQVHVMDARERIEQAGVEVRPAVFAQKPLALNVPKMDITYIEESHLDDIKHRQDEDVDLEVPNIRMEDEADLANPPLSKKPLLLNTAQLTEVPGQCEQANRLDVEQTVHQSVAMRDEDLAPPIEMAHVQPKPQPVNMGAEVVDYTIDDHAADELETERDRSEALESRLVPGVELAAAKASTVDKRNLAVVEMSRDDEFSESVKPMDTIELNFHELNETMTTSKTELRSPQSVKKSEIDEIAFGMT